jgi:hypothetical protein
MLYLIEDYMLPKLVQLYQELRNVGAYFTQYPNDSKLHLIIIDEPTISSIYEFGVPEVRRQLLLHVFGPENLQPALPQIELLLHQLPVIQY